VTALGPRARVAVLLAVALVLALVAVGYARHAAGRRAAAGAPPGQSGAPSGAPSGARLLVVADRRLATVPLADPGGPRRVGAVECDRAYAAGGTTVCLRAVTAWAYRAVVLDGAGRQRHAVDIPGLPSRARVSPSGRLVAWTTFVGGHAYSGGAFATRTGVLDTRTGAVVGSLETFRVIHDGRRYRAADVNVWGVTFAADDTRFYATMSTAGRRHLVRGDLAARTLTTVRSGVECPSLSPDGSQIAFKAAVGGDPERGWRLSVLDLATSRVTATAETASVDDQAAWLDDGTLAYTRRGPDGRPDVWAVPAHGGGAPRLLVPAAESPSPQAGSSPPQAGSSPPQAGSSPPQAGSSPPQAGSSPP
jgi:hypothetical protein